MAYLKNKHLAYIKKWNLDLSKYKDGVYDYYIKAPKDLKEFRGFKELFGFEIKEVIGYLSFYGCISLTSISNLPERVVRNLSFYDCTSLTCVSNLPKKVNGYLSFYGCTSLNSISNLPEEVSESIFYEKCPFFEGMNEAQIKEKYGILKE